MKVSDILRVKGGTLFTVVPDQLLGDALKTMALSPTRFLVVPKVLALLLAMPLLTAIANVAGIGGGYVVGVFGLDLGSTAYLSQTAQALFIRDVVVGLIKSGVFAAIIGLVGVYRGFSVQGGWEAVGKAITRTVVTSIILCIMANACFTAFFYATGTIVGGCFSPALA